MHWWPNPDSISALIESDGPWPSPSPQSNGTFLPLDVDRYDGLAVVLGYGKNRHGRDVLGTDDFQVMEDGRWDHLSGGGSSLRLDLRDRLHEAKDALQLSTTMGLSDGTG
jgi:hypothetical protein